MPVFKRKYASGKTVWRYMFSAPDSTRQDRRLIGAVGFASKQEAIDAEAQRRTEELKKYELAKAGAVTVAAALPTTFAMLLQEFFRQHAEEKLAPKTIERYRELAAYLAPELLAMPLGEITALHLSREWNRLLKSGGHHRKTKQARPLSRKTVRHVAGLVSSAFARAEKWGLVTSNPVTRSEPPVPKKHRGIALTPAQQALVFESATGPWCLATFLEVAAATGARRGEVLALRWSDIQDGRASHHAIAHPDEASVGIQGSENGEAAGRESAGVRARCSGRASEAPGCIPRAVRAGLPGGPGFDLRQPGRYAAAAELGLVGGFTAIPPAGSPQGREPALAAPQPRIAPTGRRRAVAGSVGAPGPLLGADDGGGIRARDPRPRR